MIQGAIDAARHPGDIGTTIQLPAGNFQVDQTLMIEHIAGLTLRGQGPFATQLQWAGPDNGTLLELVNANRCKIEQMSLMPAPGKSLETAVNIWQKDAPRFDKWTSSQCVFENVSIRGQGRTANGVHIQFDGVDRKNDHHRFRDVTVAGFTEAAFWIEGQNAKAAVFDGCVIRGNQTGGNVGVMTSRPSIGDHEHHAGSFHWFGGSITGCAECFRLLGRNDAILIKGIYSEKCERFLVVDLPDPRHRFPVTLSGVKFHTRYVACDGEVVRFNAAGPLTIQGSDWGKWQGDDCTPGIPCPPDKLCKFRIAREADGAAIFDGNWVGASNNNLFPEVVPDMRANSFRFP